MENFVFEGLSVVFVSEPSSKTWLSWHWISISNLKKKHESERMSVPWLLAIPSVKFWGIHLYYKLNFNLHTGNTRKSATNQLNDLVAIKAVLALMRKEVKSLNITEWLQKRKLRFLYNDYSVSYEGEIGKAEKVKIRLRS